MKLAMWAKANGLTYKTAWRMFRDGKLPAHAEKLPTGTIIVHIESFSAAVDIAKQLPHDDRVRLINEIKATL